MPILQVWDASLMEYVIYATTTQTKLHTLKDEAWFKNLQSDLLKNGFKIPMHVNKLINLKIFFAQKIAEKCDFNFFLDQKPSCVGEKYIRRVCIKLICAANSFF